jgi:hypothetical protein
MHRPRTLILLLLVGLTPLLGCASKTGLTAEYPPPEKLGRIGAAINENPDRTETILKKYNLTAQEFENAVDQVSSDPSLAKRYREGFTAGPEEFSGTRP